jgi:hypothetical protein
MTTPERRAELTAAIKEIVRKVVDAERFGGGFRIYHQAAVDELLALHTKTYREATSILDAATEHRQRAAEHVERASQMIQKSAELQQRVDDLLDRQQEHLQLITKLSREVPYSNELDDCRSARAALIARVGTLRAALREACGLAARIATYAGAAPGRQEHDRLDFLLRLAAET